MELYSYFQEIMQNKKKLCIILRNNFFLMINIDFLIKTYVTKNQRFIEICYWHQLLGSTLIKRKLFSIQNFTGN